MSIQATNYECEDMGRYFKSSKKKYKWTFLLDDKSHFLELEFSYLSGKRKLSLDGRVLHESMMLTSSFQYPFTLEGFALNVIQQGDAFELRINNKVFSHLYTQCNKIYILEKTQNEFVYEDSVTKKTEPFQHEERNQFGFNNQAFNNVPNNNKFSLNLKIDQQPKEQPNKYLAPQTQNQAFGQVGAFDDFDKFGTPSTGQTANPFGNAFQNFNPGFTESKPKVQQKVDLLDLDDAPPPPPPQQPQTQPQQQIPQQQQQQDPFGAFAWQQPSQPQQPSLTQQPIQQVQPGLIQQAPSQQAVFDPFSQQFATQPAQSPIQYTQQPNIQSLYAQNPQQVPAQQQFPVQQQFPGQQQFPDQQQFPTSQQYPPQQQFPPQQQQAPQQNILNLYGQTPVVQGNLAYHNFPSLAPQQGQFDLFK